MSRSPTTTSSSRASAASSTRRPPPAIPRRRPGRLRPDLFPGNQAQRGFNALKATLGNLYGLQIDYYVEVNFDGFKQVLDTLGGVTINVQNPVTDNYYPGDDGRLHRVYIPTGIQHMTGAEALIYARSRHGSNDFDRG